MEVETQDQEVAIAPGLPTMTVTGMAGLAAAEGMVVEIARAISRNVRLTNADQEVATAPGLPTTTATGMAGQAAAEGMVDGIAPVINRSAKSARQTQGLLLDAGPRHDLLVARQGGPLLVLMTGALHLLPGRALMTKGLAQSVTDRG